MVTGVDGAEVRVVVADDHAALRDGVRSALEDDGFTVVGEAASARAAVEVTLAQRPDISLLDVHMPGGGIAAAGEISRCLPATAVVMLTYSQDESDLFQALRAGAQGFLVKNMDPGRLGAALRGVRAGEAALPRHLVSRVLEEFRRPAPRRLLARRRGGPELTDRERDVMELLREGLSTEDVASRLCLTPGTVRVHVSNVVKKLGVADRAAALGALGHG